MTATSATTYLLTADELDGFPNDGKRREIIEGVLFVAAAPSLVHQETLGRLYKQVDALVGPLRLGRVFFAPIDVRFSNHDLVQPDIVFVRRERREICRVNTIRGAPDLIIEVLSPSNRGYDLAEKLRLYERYLVPEYWVFDPERLTVAHFVLTDGRFVQVQPVGGVYRSTVIAEFVVDPNVLFADLDAW